MRKFILLIFLCAGIWFDAFSKYLAELYLKSGETIEIIEGFIRLKLSYNTGIAFSFPIEWLPLQIITIGLIAAIIYQYFQLEYEKRSYTLDIAYMLILAGWISHAYERVFVWHVVDFIAVKYFAILNFADIFISVWIFLLLLFYVWIKYNRKHWA